MDEKWIDRSIRRDCSPVGWTLVIYYGIMNILAVLAMAAGGIGQFLREAARGNFGAEPDLAALTGNAWGYILTIAVGLVILHAWKGGDFFREEVFRREKRITAGTFLALLCLCAGTQLLSSLWISGLEAVMNAFDRSLLEELEMVSGASDTVSMFLYSAILAPISEEILFRGYALRALRPYGKRFSIFASAFLFGMFHGNLLQAPYAFLVGLILGYAAVEYSIWWAIVLHVFNNLVLADLMARGLSLLPEMAGEIVSFAVLAVFFLIALGVLIARRREVKAYRQGEWIDRRCLRCFFTSPGVVILMLMMVGSMVMALFV